MDVDGGAAVGLLGRSVGNSGSVNDESGVRVAVPSITVWHPASAAAAASIAAALSRVLIGFQPNQLWRRTRVLGHAGFMRTPGNLDAQIHETHTGLVVLLGERAYKAKKAVKTDFLDFSTVAQRSRALHHEVTLNRRLAPQSYLGVGEFTMPGGSQAEPVIVMRRYPDSARLTTLVAQGKPLAGELREIAGTLAVFHRDARRGPEIDTQGSPAAVWERWDQNLTELRRHADVVFAGADLDEIGGLAQRFLAGRSALMAQRIAQGRIVDGHADLLTDDIFCMPEGPAMLDCLEFDDRLRYVDGVDDAAFLAMDLEFHAHADLGDEFLREYLARAADPAPRSLQNFYIAYRAVVRAKVDCVRVEQGHPEAADDARRHLRLAGDRLRDGAVGLAIVGGGPGSGKTTVSRALAEVLGAQVISTDDVRRELRDAGVIGGAVGALDSGLYAPESVARVYDEVLRRAETAVTGGCPVVLDGTWRDEAATGRARRLAAGTATPLVEFTCVLPVEQAEARIRARTETTSDATPQIAAALAERTAVAGRHPLDTGRPAAESVAEAQRIYRKVVSAFTRG